MPNSTRGALNWLGVGALALIAVGGFVLNVKQSNQAAKELEALRGQVAGLQQQVNNAQTSRLESAVLGTLQERALASTLTPTPSAIASVEAPNVDPKRAPSDAQLSHEEREHRSRVYHEAKTNECERAFSQERADPEWSNTAQQKLEQKYSGEEFQALHSQVECRSTLCRVKFSFDEGQAGLQATGQVQEKMPWSGGSFMHADMEKRSGMIFVGREGHALPQVDRDSLQY